MTKVKVKNPTGKSKAVRQPGGFVVLKPGVDQMVDAIWSDEERLRYEAAGLEFAETKAGRNSKP